MAQWREDPDPFGADERGALSAQIFSVSELTARLKGLLGDLGRISVEGEVAGLRKPASGHLYFNLKDRLRGIESVLGCAIWRSQVERATRTPLEEGARIVAHGRLDVYGPRGSYSLIVDRVEPRGMGALLEALEKRKREWKEAGKLDRRRALPTLPETIGVVTSRDGAALQDFLRTRSLRWPEYPVRLAHTSVQGPGAAPEIAEALSRLDASGVDLVVLCRGGGSLEDLWAFNEEAVAQAIWNCSVPVISGVGHETDVTLADLVADHRAHTPTDAAQTAIPDRRALVEELRRFSAHLSDAIDRQLTRRAEQLDRCADARVLRDARWILSDRAEDLAALGGRLVRAQKTALEAREARLGVLAARLSANGPGAALDRSRERLSELARRLHEGVVEGLRGREMQLDLVARSLAAISPLAVLERGYSLTRRVASGEVVTDAAQLATGDEVETHLARGAFRSRVEADGGADA